jgi:bifunctional DNA-binding transcriptional regulator/antitoxin component of YhaV-PrlF toxin-antitoxin module
MLDCEVRRIHREGRGLSTTGVSIPPKFRDLLELENGSMVKMYCEGTKIVMEKLAIK